MSFYAETVAIAFLLIEFLGLMILGIKLWAPLYRLLSIDHLAYGLLLPAMLILLGTITAKNVKHCFVYLAGFIAAAAGFTMLMFLISNGNILFGSLIIQMGGLLNFACMSMNNFKMPVFRSEEIRALNCFESKKHFIADENVKLGFLADRFPSKNCGVFSIGDVIIGAGVYICSYELLFAS